MTVWDAYDQNKKKRRFVRTCFGIISLVLVIIAISSGYYLSQHRGDVTAPDVIYAMAISSESNTPREANSFSSQLAESPADAVLDVGRASLNTSFQITESATGTGVYYGGQSKYSGLITNSPPAFEGNIKKNEGGPSSLVFNVATTGNTYESSISVASFIPTEIEGAAGEWRVRPWWRPGWIPSSVDCGELGTTVIAGHVSWYDNPGPFFEIAALVPGDIILCTNSSGKVFRYEVSEGWVTGYNDISSYSMSPQPGETSSVLSLYTCTREIRGISVIRAMLLPDNAKEIQ